MTSRKARFRRSAVGGVLFILAPLAAGCGAQIGSAAVIGDTAISTASIERESSTVAAIGSDTLVTELGEVGIRVQTDRLLLTYEIWHELLTQSGTAEPLTNDQVNQVISGYQGASPIGEALGATPETLNDRISDTSALHLLVSDAVAQGAAIDGPSVTVEYLYVQDLNTALADRTKYLADPAAMTAAVAAATASNAGGQGTASVLGAGADLIPTGLFSALPGQIVVSPAGANQTLIARVVDRTVGPQTLTASDVGQLSTSQINAIGAIILSQRGVQLPSVQVNPRFGVWDPELLQVVAAPAQL